MQICRNKNKTVNNLYLLLSILKGHCRDSESVYTGAMIYDCCTWHKAHVHSNESINSMNCFEYRKTSMQKISSIFIRMSVVQQKQNEH